MKAMAVFPGKPGSIHLADLPDPSVNDVPNGRGVLVEVLRVGVDGTDKEINDAEYGAAPEGYDFLVTGHESFGRVVEVGPNVRGLENYDEMIRVLTEEKVLSRCSSRLTAAFEGEQSKRR